MATSSSDTSMTDSSWTGKLRSFLNSFLITVDSGPWISKVPVLLKRTSVTSFDLKELDLSEMHTVGRRSDSRISLLKIWSSSRLPFHKECYVAKFNFKTFPIQMRWCNSSVLTLLCSVILLPCARVKQCPGDKASCPDDSTCCPLHSGNFGCCPFQNAVCCPNGIYCCPGGYTCDIVNSLCKLDVKSKPCVPTIPVTLVCFMISLFISVVS